jgi:SAM-dependent methyltransferase
VQDHQSTKPQFNPFAERDATTYLVLLSGRSPDQQTGTLDTLTMALAHFHITLFCELRRAGVVGNSRSSSLLEFGEQNWFGDVNPREIGKLIDEFYQPGGEQDAAQQDLDSLVAELENDKGAVESGVLFALAKHFYRVVLRHETYAAADLHATDHAWRHDLNLPLPYDDQYDVVTNLGTAEHVFNQYQLFRSMHERTKPSGLMVHSLPNQGCYDHGFFNFHPTLVFDLAQANAYQIVSFVYFDASKRPVTLVPIRDREEYVRMATEQRLSNYSGLLAVFRKDQIDQPFQTPIQGYYDNALPSDLIEAWRKLPK